MYYYYYFFLTFWLISLYTPLWLLDLRVFSDLFSEIMTYRLKSTENPLHSRHFSSFLPDFLQCSQSQCLKRLTMCSNLHVSRDFERAASRFRAAFSAPSASPLAATCYIENKTGKPKWGKCLRQSIH